MGIGIDFDWQTEGDAQTNGSPPAKTNGGLSWLAVAFVLLALILGGWFGFRRWQENREADLQAALQAVLDLEKEAVAAGDGELFRDLQTNDPAWIAAQLLPRNQAFNRAARQVTRAGRSAAEAWANVVWRENGQAWQRIAFFHWDGSQWQRSNGSAAYWGETKRYAYEWGVLVIPKSDQAWRTLISRFIEQRLPPDAPELTISLLPQDGPPLGLETPTANDVQLPSPRFWGLDENGQPGDPFWSALSALLQPRAATLRFVVPDAALFRYLGLAQSFARDYLPPDYGLEIIPAGSLPSDPRLWLPQVDGARLMPDETLIAAGYVRDLTDLMQRDLQFDQADFYQQIWQAAWWQDRMWVAPGHAIMNLIFYNREAFRQADLPLPQAGWTWADLTAAASQLSHPLAEGRRYWGVIDISADLVWGYGFSWGSGCVTGPCLPALVPERLDAALAWYGQHVGAALPDVSRLDETARQLAELRWLTLQQTAMWVSSPVEYETGLSRLSLGVAPFPLSAAQVEAGGKDAGITPLHVSGFIISQSSAYPRLMWAWLRYLSYASPDQLRAIPARPSVAEQTLFWRRLPGQLGPAISAAFPLSRPILIGEENWVTWEQLQNPTVPTSSRPRWFQRLNSPN